MPLAQAAPRIGCERSPSLARPRQRRLDSATVRTRGRPRSMIKTGPIRAQAIVVRDGPLDGSGRDADIAMIQAHTLPWLSQRIDPSAENRRPSEAHKRGTGEPPQLRSRGRRFGSDILCQTGRNRSTRSMGRRPGWSSPRRRDSGRSGVSIRTPSPSGRVPVRTEAGDGHRSDSVLCLIMRHPRVRAVPPPTWSRRESRSVPLLSDHVTGDIL